MTTAPTLTPVPGATPRYDDDGNEIVNVATCGTCGRSWNDAAISSWTPAPSARCPFEYEHEGQDEDGLDRPRRYHVESRFSNLEYKAQLALGELQDFWTEMYGPNEALTAAFECLDALRETFDEAA